MTFDFSRCLPELAGRGLLPASYRSAFVVGSLARGWANAASDVDIYVVGDTPWSGPASAAFRVSLGHPEVPTDSWYTDDRRWELKYWTTGQLAEVLDKVSWDSFETALPIGQLLGRDEEQLLERLLFCRPLDGEQWVEEQRQLIRASAFGASVVSYCLTNADDFVDDALGQLAEGDTTSAVLSARQAFGHAVDGLLASHGECNRLVKWRARRMLAACPKALPFERYWAVETMTDFDAAAPDVWVRDVVALCKSLSLEIEV
ncbi:nucleotidyltransferase domain-containing protein [Streptomyces sp. NPDC048384]|uniref:nucleotidyltransferase domain-containing protein n=1 Tax=Streptomyces sp. NPDC048384 TaxID=3155487 RepID=UPI00342F7EC7